MTSNTNTISRQHTTLMIRCKGYGRNPANNRVASCGPGLQIAQDTPMLDALDQASALGWEIETSYSVSADTHITFVLRRDL